MATACFFSHHLSRSPLLNGIRDNSPVYRELRGQKVQRPLNITQGVRRTKRAAQIKDQRIYDLN